MTSRQKVDDKCCWFIVPEIIIGIPKYDQAACIAFVMDKLTDNGFMVKYYHPNAIFINWSHWVPSYVRTELKKKTGIEINEYGVPIGKDTEQNKMIENGMQNNIIFNNKTTNNDITLNNKQNKKYTPINNYKPSGNLVYSEKLLNKIEDRIL